jgi:flagellin-like hook-associated protein FlgL
MNIKEWIHKKTAQKNKIEYDYDPESGLVFIEGIAYHENYFRKRAGLKVGHIYKVIDKKRGLDIQELGLDDITDQEIAQQVQKNIDEYNNYYKEFMLRIGAFDKKIDNIKTFLNKLHDELF